MISSVYQFINSSTHQLIISSFYHFITSPVMTDDHGVYDGLDGVPQHEAAVVPPRILRPGSPDGQLRPRAGHGHLGPLLVVLNRGSYSR